MKRDEYISDEAVVKRANEAVRIELEKKRAMDIPIIVYDIKTQNIKKKNIYLKQNSKFQRQHGSQQGK